MYKSSNFFSLINAVISRERGNSLLEAVIAIGLIAMIGVGYLSATATGLSGAGILQEHSTAENLARNQIEDIRALPFNDDYLVSVETPMDYEITIEVVDLSPPDLPLTLQKLIVHVAHGGQPVLSIENYKARL